MILEHYQARWAGEFCDLAHTIRGHLSDRVIQVHHVGSTAVPGMLAKPILDIDIEVPAEASPETVGQRLSELGYVPQGDRGIADRYSFGRESDRTPITNPPRRWMEHHLYVCPSGTVELGRHLHFRDALVASPELREEYRTIKLKAVESASGDRKLYQARKDALGGEFFARVLALPPIGRSINRGHDQVSRVAALYTSGQLDEAAWFRELSAITTPAYLAADNPRAQSGHSGDEAHWTTARSLILDAMPRDGTFLDIGCANGYLMESVQRWGDAKGLTIEPHGLEIAPELADLARRRLPHWADQIYTSNAMDWLPPRRFDFVRTGFYAPPGREADLVRHLLHYVVAPGGRLIVGVQNEPRASICRPTTAEHLGAWGFKIAGQTERPHRDCRLCYRAVWIDQADRCGGL